MATKGAAVALVSHYVLANSCAPLNTHCMIFQDFARIYSRLGLGKGSPDVFQHARII